MALMIHFGGGSDHFNNIETNKHPPKMIYLSALDWMLNMNRWIWYISCKSIFGNMDLKFNIQGRILDLQKEGAECQNWREIGWYGPKIGWICMI